MSLGATLPQSLPMPVPVSAGVTNRLGCPRVLGAVLAGANMSEVASFDFAGGTAAVFTSAAPNKSTSNEDVAALMPISDSSGILAVADGLGGHMAGEQASQTAIETIRGKLIDALPAQDGNPTEELRGMILDGIEAANPAVKKIGAGAATTLALVEVQGQMIRPYHVGDSVILLTGQRGKLKFQSISHSPIGYAVEAGMLAEEEAIHHEDRHVISNVIGSDQMRIEIGPSIEMAERDTLILASDGLVDNLLPGEIVEFIRSGPLAESLRSLVDEARRRMSAADGGPSKPDDLTVIAYRAK